MKNLMFLISLSNESLFWDINIFILFATKVLLLKLGSIEGIRQQFKVLDFMSWVDKANILF